MFNGGRSQSLRYTISFYLGILCVYKKETANKITSARALGNMIVVSFQRKLADIFAKLVRVGLITRLIPFSIVPQYRKSKHINKYLPISHKSNNQVFVIHNQHASLSQRIEIVGTYCLKLGRLQTLEMGGKGLMSV